MGDIVESGHVDSWAGLGEVWGCVFGRSRRFQVSGGATERTMVVEYERGAAPISRTPMIQQ